MTLLNLTASETEIHGPLKYIVRSAHKWGGNGAVPDFNKIKRVLSTKHPEVIAKAFGGDPNRAAAWIKDGWEKYHGRVLPGKGGAGPTYWRGKGKGGSTDDDATMDIPNPFDSDEVELFLADGEEAPEVVADGLWHPVCRTGTWQASPVPGGKPLEITLDRLNLWKDAFDDKAWENVTLPLTHKDTTAENTGFVKALDIRPDPVRPGHFKLWAKHHFTEPEILEKVKRGTIRGRSVGVAIKGLKRTSDGKFFPEVLKHVCLTNHPWLDGLNDGEAQIAAAFELDPDDQTWQFALENDEGSLDASLDELELGMQIGDALRAGDYEEADRLIALAKGEEGDAVEAEPADTDGNQLSVVGHVGAPCTLGDMVAGDYFLSAAAIQHENKTPDQAAELSASHADLPDMPAGVHHCEGDHPDLKGHKLVTEVHSGRQGAMHNSTRVQPFVPYMSDGEGDAGEDPPMVAASHDKPVLRIYLDHHDPRALRARARGRR